MPTTIKPRVWFITGTSSGFGRSLTELLLKNGEIVVATLRQPDALAELSSQYSSQLLVLRLDVAVLEDITQAFKDALQQFGRIDVVVNNAGSGLVGEIEGVPEDLARNLFEVNFWGPLRVSKEAIRVFRDVNSPQGGLVIQIASILGMQFPPILGYYSASKLALEGISETLANELDPAWNIHVTIIQSGWFRTQIVKKGTFVPQHEAYKSSPGSNALYHVLNTESIDYGDATQAVEVIYRVANLPSPPLHFPLGKDMLGALKKRGAQYLATAEEYESWSGDLRRG